MLFRAFLLVVSSLSVLGFTRAIAQDADPFQRVQELQRGINLSHWFASQPDHGTNPNQVITVNDILLLKDLNFDHVRIPIDPAQWNDGANGVLCSDRSATKPCWVFRDELDKAVSQILSNGLRVVLVMFPDDNYKCGLVKDAKNYLSTDKCAPSPDTKEAIDTECQKLTGDSPTPKFFLNERQKEFEGVWRDAADHFSKKPNVFFEILNEPQVSDQALAQWAQFECHLMKTIRRIAKDNTIIATAGGYSGLEDLLKFDPIHTSVGNVIYTFHYYLPDEFTQQNPNEFWTFKNYEPISILSCDPAKPSPNCRPPSEQTAKPFPYSPTPGNVDTNVDSVVNPKDLYRKHAVKEFGFQIWDLTHLESDMRFARQWGEQNHVPVWCGEFGVNIGANEFSDPDRESMRVKWFGDMHTALRDRGVGWAVWDYRTHDFGLADCKPAHAPYIDPKLTQALGLQNSSRTFKCDPM